jgi:DNA polymerase III epsilon subunit family exonuclease
LETRTSETTIESRDLRTENLETLRGRAHRYIHDVNRPVGSRELSRALFRKRERGEVSPLLIRTLLGTDSRFLEPHSGTWQLAASTHLQEPLETARFIVVDLEATGSNPRSDQLIEIGMVRLEGTEVTWRYDSLVRPGIPIPSWIQRLTGIRETSVDSAPSFAEIAPSVMEGLRDAIFVAHNVDFDMPFLYSHLRAEGFRPPHCSRLCTVNLARRALPDAPAYRLNALAAHLGVALDCHHRAIEDAEATASILVELIAILKARGVKTVGQLLEHAAGPPRVPRTPPPAA